MKVLITGCAGFIGMHVTQFLLNHNIEVIGIDNLNSYYDPVLKEARLAVLNQYVNFRFYLLNITNQSALIELFKKESLQRVIHLAAQAGVRYSLESPQTYLDANVQGFLNILEACRAYPVEHLVYASSSSVYGNIQGSCIESQNVDHPVSLYAATKKSNELMAYTYSHLFHIPTTGLRFFTVYGPWGRPDMAFFKFTKKILHGESIEIYNYGDMTRDFTYIDDVVEGLFRVLNKTPKERVPYRLFNIGNGAAIQLMDCIQVLEENLGIIAKKQFLPMQPGDVRSTLANTEALYHWVGFKPHTDFRQGIAQFVNWYRDFYNE